MRILSLALLTLALPLGGCCSLARLFCGPDRSPWVSIDYQSPERAVRTFLEALRRDDPEVLYLSLSRDFRRRLGVDQSTTELAWPKIREQNPGLHLAGYAEVPEPTRSSPDTASVTLDVEGQLVRVLLQRECFREVRYSRPGREPGTFGPPGSHGERLDAFTGAVRVERIDDEFRDRSRVTLEPVEFEHTFVDEVPTELLEAIVLERRWKIAALQTE